MKTILLILCLLLVGCTTTPTTPSAQQVLVANAVEDALSVGLVPVLAKNPAYAAEAKTAAALLRAFDKTAFVSADVEALFTGRLKVAPDDARLIVALISASWDVYQRRYREQVGQVRPDVQLFARAVANGIDRAVAAVPKG
jgi:hypothetical protein